MGGSMLSGVDCVYVVCIIRVVHGMVDRCGLYVVYGVCWGAYLVYVYGVYDSIRLP